MTTNAMLLDRYMDYLVEKGFHLLVSLDGDKHGDSYRVDKCGNSSFERVMRNVKRLQTNYPKKNRENPVGQKEITIFANLKGIIWRIAISLIM